MSVPRLRRAYLQGRARGQGKRLPHTFIVPDSAPFQIQILAQLKRQYGFGRDVDLFSLRQDLRAGACCGAGGGADRGSCATAGNSAQQRAERRPAPPPTMVAVRLLAPRPSPFSKSEPVTA